MPIQFNAKNKFGIKPQWEMGDLLVSYLSQLGVQFVFGVPGGAIEPLYNALARSARRNGPRPIVARHETGAAFMADGYYYNSGKLGVCCATTGPGSTNLTTGICSAYQHRVPLLVITAQTASTHFGRGAFQESSCTGIDTIGIFDHCTRYNSFVSHIDQFEYKLVSAIRHALGTPRGPSHLSIPVDLLRQPSVVQKPSFDLSRLHITPEIFDKYIFSQFKTLLLLAKKPVFVIDGHCTRAINSIIDVAVLLQAKIVTTPQGKGLINAHHPLYCGVIGFAGHQEAHAILTDSDVDVVIAVGSSLGEWATDGWNPELLLNDRLIHVSDTEFDFSHSPQARLHVLGNLNTVFTQLHESLHTIMPSRVINKVNREINHQLYVEPKLHFTLNESEKQWDNTTPIKPQSLMLKLAESFPANSYFLVDSGNSMAWATHYLHPQACRLQGSSNYSAANVRASMEFGSMGWAIGCAVGTALACPGDPVVCITGDGSMLMSGQEITVAIQENLPVIFVILNDAALGMVKHGQRLAGAEAVAFELPEIDFSAIAHAMGVPGYVIHSVLDFDRLDIDAICRRHGPTVLDVRIDAEEVPPMGSRMRVLGTVK